YASTGYSPAGAQGTIMIARRNVFLGLCICPAFAIVGARAAEPSAKSFVEAIYSTYTGKNSNGLSLDNDAAVRRYFEPKLAALIIKDRKAARRGREARRRPLHRCAGLGRSTPSISPSVRLPPTRRARPLHSKMRASSAPLSSTSSSSARVGASPTSLGT